MESFRITTPTSMAIAVEHKQDATAGDCLRMAERCVPNVRGRNQRGNNQ